MLVDSSLPDWLRYREIALGSALKAGAVREEEDVAQEALLILLRNRCAIRDPEAFIAGTARKLAAGLRRSTARRLAREHRYASFLSNASGSPERRLLLHSWLDRLGTDDCLLVNIYTAGFTVREIASRLGTTKSSISRRLRAILAA